MTKTGTRQAKMSELTNVKGHGLQYLFRLIFVDTNIVSFRICIVNGVDGLETR